MDPIKTLGTFLTGGEERDAIHIAVLPVTAGEDLRPGDPVTLAYGTSDIVIGASDDYGVNPSIGIVDPFLAKDFATCRVTKGTRFWLFLHPNTVTGMRHHWQHPAIDNPPKPQNDSELWLHQFAQRWGFNYDELLHAAVSGGDYVVAHGRDLHSADELGADYDLFWQHLALFTGRTFDEPHRAKVSWSCTC